MHPILTVLGVRLPLYGLCLAVGVLLFASIGFFRVKRVGVGIYDLLIVLASSGLSAALGARILYIVITYSPAQIGAIVCSGNWLYLLSTGQIFYGGLIGGLFGGFLAIRLLKEDPEPYCYALVPCVPLVHSIGRIGCLFAGCCHGRLYQGFLAVPLAIDGMTNSYFPIQLVEAALLLLLSAVLFRLSGRMLTGANMLRIYLLVYAMLRFLLEWYRGDDLRGAWLGLSTSQWISLLIICVILICWKFRRNQMCTFQH